MKKVYSKHFPKKGYVAISLFGIIFIRKESKWRFNKVVESHEKIHFAQQREMLFLPFFVWYGVEYIVRLIINKNHMKAYKSISFEKEAYTFQKISNYAECRTPFSWLQYVFKK